VSSGRFSEAMLDRGDFQKNEGRIIMKYTYCRVSTIEQNEARQLEAMKDKGIERYFTEKISGKNTDRPELQTMLDFVREGDTIYIHDFSRLARSTKDLLDIVERLNAKGVHLISNKENLDTSTPTGKLMLTMIGAINEFERQNMLERQREGIQIAKDNGKYKGRKPVEIDDKLFQETYTMYLNRKINKVEFAKIIKVSRPTLDKMLKEVTSI
jgi:DNA invertase Pin-like site-specific DNA recombinase